MLKSLQPSSFLLTTTIRPIPSAQRSTIISLLHEHYSVCEIESRTGIGKSTIGRIKKEVDTDKENNKGVHPSKLSPRNKQSICCQITTGKLDNTVQAAHFINSILPNPVSAQTVRNVLKENGFSAVIKKKHPLLKRCHREDHLKFAKYHENWTVEDWKRVLWSDETKINRIGSDGRVYTWKERGSPLSDCTTTPTVKHGGGNNLMVPLPQWGILPTTLPHLAHQPLPSCTPLPPLPLVVRPRKPRSGQITLLLLRSARPLRAPRLTVAELPSPSLPTPPSSFSH